MFYRSRTTAMNYGGLYKKDLFIDDYFLESIGQAEFRVNQPSLVGPVFNKRYKMRQWENVYYSVVKNPAGSRWKYYMYYIASIMNKHIVGVFPEQYVCVACSNDGIDWKELPQGKYEFEKDTKNNCVFRSQGAFIDGFYVFYDTNPSCPEEEKYKATYEHIDKLGQSANMFWASSPDGINWTERGELMNNKYGLFDTMNCVWYDNNKNAYVMYFRRFFGHVPSRHLGESCETMGPTSDGTYVRGFLVTYSNDFRTWSEPIRLTYQCDNEYQLYSPCIHKVPGTTALIGLPTRFYQRDNSPTAKEICKYGQVSFENGAGPMDQWNTSYSDTLFISGRDCENFHIYEDKPFIEPLIEDGYNWRYREGFMGYAFIEDENNKLHLFSTLMNKEDVELMHYITEKDRYCSLHSQKETEIITKPFVVGEAKELWFNFKTTAAGGFKVAITDIDDNPIEGFSFDDCNEVYGNTTARAVRWNGSSALPDLKDKAFKLHIKMHECDLYAFEFVSI